MNNFLETLSSWLQQAWVYIPAILSFITAIGLPSLIQISKIFLSAKLYLEQVKTLKDKINVLISTTNAFNKVCNDLIQIQLQELADQIEFLELQKALTYNKKLQKAIQERIEKIKAKIEELRQMNVGELVDKIIDADLNKKSSKKVKVKVVNK